MKRTAPALRIALVAALFGSGCGEAASNEGNGPKPATPVAAPGPTPEPTPQSTPQPTTAPAPDPEPVPPPAKDMLASYATVLAEVVTDAGLVRYDLLADRKRRGALDEVVRWMAAAPLPEERTDRLAFWCNAYNANVLAAALDASTKPGFENVVKVPGFFDARPITVAGETLTLNALENERIRPLGDARIHAALVCAALSCPPLRNEPYVAEKLDDQFSDQCVRWVNDDDKFRVAGGRLGLSEILKWYAPDFDLAPHFSQVGFVLAYAKSGSALSRYIINTPEPAVDWLTYDWSLNRAPAEPAGGESGGASGGESGGG